MAWYIETDSGFTVHVDARTGEILGGDLTKATYARSVCSVSRYYYGAETRSANMARSGLERLGYTHHLNVVDYEIQQADIEYVLIHSRLKAIYLNCHGSHSLSTYITDNNNWKLHANKIPSGWKFVFLDACWSSTQNFPASDFPKQMINVDGTKQCFVGWNDSVKKQVSDKFNGHFWIQVGYSNIYDIVISARNQTSTDTPYTCNPDFWGDINYNGGC